MSSKGRQGRAAFYAEPMPRGFYFDPYMGDGIGALRLVGSHMKVADEVDRAMAELLAWSIVTPALRTLERACGQWDQAGRLWGHEWKVVAWMAMAIYEGRMDGQAHIVILDQSFLVRCVSENIMSTNRLERTIEDGLE